MSCKDGPWSKHVKLCDKSFGPKKYSLVEGKTYHQHFNRKISLKQHSSGYWLTQIKHDYSTHGQNIACQSEFIYSTSPLRSDPLLSQPWVFWTKHKFCHAPKKSCHAEFYRPFQSDNMTMWYTYDDHTQNKVKTVADECDIHPSISILNFKWEC